MRRAKKRFKILPWEFVLKRSYCLISPCRNEEKYLRQSMESVLRQTVLPSLWVIVDDGSTDATPQILTEFEEKYSFIRVITRRNRGFRSVGPGVIQAFNTGYRAIEPESYEYLCKLDLDLDLPPRYFEVLIERMEADTRLGTCSGKPYFVDEQSGDLISEACGDDMSVGMTQVLPHDVFPANWGICVAGHVGRN